MDFLNKSSRNRLAVKKNYVCPRNFVARVSVVVVRTDDDQLPINHRDINQIHRDISTNVSILIVRVNQ
jgi:hypothetical protein